MKTKISFTIIFLMITLVSIMFGLSGCGKEKHSVNFESEWEKECFDGLKDSYEEGTKVKLYYGNEFIGTDTDYSFYLDDERLNVDYSSSKGYIISFKMPDHDVTLKVNKSGSMEQLG